MRAWRSLGTDTWSWHSAIVLLLIWDKFHEKSPILSFSSLLPPSSWGYRYPNLVSWFTLLICWCCRLVQGKAWFGFPQYVIMDYSIVCYFLLSNDFATSLSTTKVTYKGVNDLVSTIYYHGLFHSLMILQLHFPWRNIRMSKKSSYF